MSNRRPWTADRKLSTVHGQPSIVVKYLDLLDAQREAAFGALEGITDSQLWQRPAPKEWSIGEILDHNYLLIASMYPVVERMWKFGNMLGLMPMLLTLPSRNV